MENMLTAIRTPTKSSTAPPFPEMAARSAVLANGPWVAFMAWLV